MKSLWVASWYPNRYSPLNGDFIQRMAIATRSYCSLAVLSVAEGAVADVKLEVRSGHFLEVLVYVPAASNTSRFFAVTRAIRAGRHLKAYWKGLNYITKHFGKPDILHLHVIFPAGLFVLFLSLWFNIPFLITEHWTGFRRINWKKLRWYHKRLGRSCTSFGRYILPVSPALVEDMQALGFFGNYAVLPNVVNINQFKPPKVRSKGSKFRFLHVSNQVNGAKNITGILDATRQLAKERQDFELYLIGDGPDREMLGKKVEADGLNQIVAFVGELEHVRVSQEMQRADALLMFSNYENLPCVILEALATGLPVIATETGGIKDWVTPGKGFLVKPGDKAGLVAAMKKAMDKRNDFDPEFIRSEVAEQCSYDTVGRKIAAFYHEVLGTKEPLPHE